MADHYGAAIPTHFSTIAEPLIKRIQPNLLHENILMLWRIKSVSFRSLSLFNNIFLFYIIHLFYHDQISIFAAIVVLTIEFRSVYGTNPGMDQTI